MNLAKPSLGLPAAMIVRSLGMEVVTETSVENELLGLSTILVLIPALLIEVLLAADHRLPCLS